MFNTLLAAAAVVSASQTPEGLASLDWLLGTWESKETSYSPDGKETSFTLKGKNTRALAGRYLKIEESFSLPGAGAMENLILIGYDPRAKEFQANWYSSNENTPTLFKGGWKDKDFVLSSAAIPGRPSLRIVYHPLESGHYRAELEVLRADKWEIATRAEYRRVASGL